MRSKVDRLQVGFHQRHLTSFSWLCTKWKSGESSSYWSAASELAVLESAFMLSDPTRWGGLMQSDSWSAEDGFFQEIWLLLNSYFLTHTFFLRGIKNSPYRYFSHVFKIDFYGNYTQWTEPCKTEIISVGCKRLEPWASGRPFLRSVCICFTLLPIVTSYYSSQMLWPQ